MGTTKAMESKRPVYEILVWRGAEQTQEPDTAVSMSAQKPDDATEEEQISSGVVHRKRRAVPIQEKLLLTLEEAAEYTGLGMQKLRDISSHETCQFVLWNGAKRMFKRKELEAYLANAYSI